MKILKATEKSAGIVKRETTVVYRHRPLMVELRPVDTRVNAPDPGGMLVFRMKKTQKEYPLHLVTAFELAVKLEAQRIAAARKKAREEKRKARREGL